ncbi:MAG: hypothetical protein QF721_05955 [Verrucomicrobiota bacterium]|jgi:hypothetical protein|nr:hypothetical protein [Verrucomicrobiota bacterium]MDP7048973.1 hypothetical protein [Verrucomicrobiota bacterium]
MKKNAMYAATSIIMMAVFTCGSMMAQVKQGKTRPLKTGQLMKGLVKPNCTQLKKGLDAGPDSDKAWAELAMNAALINEISYTLMADGRCPDGTWAKANDTLRECSSAILKAVNSKNVEEAKKAFSAMVKACSTCHDAHKKKK